MTIKCYIKFGEYYENLKIETPKQTNLTFYEYEYSHCERKHISEALDIERDDWSSIYWVVNALRRYYPYLPYHFRDLKRRRWNGIRCLEDKNCSIIHEDFFIIVNLKKEFRELVECYGRVIERKKRSQKGLGQLFRCNKLLINNGYEPVDFNVERGDIKRMIALDETTMSEIRENKDRRVFKRDGIECRMIGERMINLETGKEMQWELGYKI